MTLTSTGLTNGGATAHYQFQYGDSLSAQINPGGLEPRTGVNEGGRL